MKRKDVIKTINETAELTHRVDGSMIVRNDETGESYDVDVPLTLAIARGVMAWFLTLFECSDELDGQKQVQSMLVGIAKSIEQHLEYGRE